MRKERTQTSHSLMTPAWLLPQGRRMKKRSGTSANTRLAFRSFLARIALYAVLPPTLALTGCREPTDAELFNRAVEAVSAGESTRLDMRKHTDITDAELMKLAGLSGLRWLRLDGCQITDDNVHYLVSIPDLETLYVSDTRISDAGLDQICSIRTLKKLTIDGTPITDKGLGSLRELPNLEELSLWRCYVTDRGCDTLAELRGLKKLSLDGTQVTDKGVRKLFVLKDLERISLWKTPVTDRGVAALKKALPNLEVNQ